MAIGVLWPALATLGYGMREATRPSDGDAGEQNPDTGGDDAGSSNQDDVNPWSDIAWQFPVPNWNGYVCQRSQEYRPEPYQPPQYHGHHGVDLMYERTFAGGELANAWPPGTINGSKRFFMPDGIRALAAADGTIWSSGFGVTGGYVVIDHGAPFASFYVHLSSLIVPTGIQRGQGKIAIKAGDPLGIIGAPPNDPELKHLHFEVWDDRQGQRGGANHVDPWPFIQNAPHVNIEMGPV